MTIQVLSGTLVNQIAAGEVVERPSSIVKELVENALDAQAKCIDVELKDGGKKLIRVVDDGSGMSRQDATLCIERHATSKIRTLQDLIQVSSLGFRGEALPSIASVSRFELLTRPEGQTKGTRVLVEGDITTSIEDAGCASGTEISVRNLFYNVPVRRRFLRASSVELGHCVDVVVREALARPGVDFSVIHDGKVVLRAPVAENLAQRAGQVLGSPGRKLIPTHWDREGVRVEALISPASVHKGSGRAASYLFVNGRFVREPLLRKAIQEGYRGIVPKGRSPLVIMHLTLDPERVDVNVHPAKTEVRFQEPREILRLISTGLREGLQSRGIVPTSALRAPEPALPPHPEDDQRLPSGLRPFERTPVFDLDASETPGGAQGNLWMAADSAGEESPTGDGKVSPLAQKMALKAGRFRDLRVIGQCRGRYILAEFGGELTVVDQHAAMEWLIQYDLSLSAHPDGGQTRPLETPVMVELTRAQVAALDGSMDALNALGLCLTPMSPTAVAIRSVPAPLNQANPKALIEAVADEASRRRAESDPLHSIRRVIARQHVGRRATPLSLYDMRSILAALDEVELSEAWIGPPLQGVFTDSEIAKRIATS